ncbi:ATP-binding protein [Nocardioides sp. KIGAM211]|uniref:DNA topoisomerase (ATP-hydrolyzing) n=1 Tax=Nocardioides luti TaxID=2761101 RepID=A0A7X0VA00_9ACTN|nr:ATP-binding protein [Nocardioides luti]MBB6626835.1 ATP-binding protein [Nocardioides luti]
MTRWRNTTHDWAAVTDVEHLATIRERADHYAPGGALHLVLEVVAYAADEAADAGAGRCRVALQSDGSVCVSDDGRGTDTRRSEAGVTIKKPVMSTRDLRFFDAPSPPDLADGHPRRGISVVAALSTWLVHTNRRRDGSWTQRYERGVPVTDLVPVEDDGSTGTTVEFLPDLAVLISDPALRERLEVLAWPPPLVVDVTGDGPLAT